MGEGTHMRMAFRTRCAAKRPVTPAHSPNPTYTWFRMVQEVQEVQEGDGFRLGAGRESGSGRGEGSVSAYGGSSKNLKDLKDLKVGGRVHHVVPQLLVERSERRRLPSARRLGFRASTSRKCEAVLRRARI